MMYASSHTYGSANAYDLWGQTVNLASRMQTLCLPGMVLVTKPVSHIAGPTFVFDRHTITTVKGVGPVATCLLLGRAEERDHKGGTRIPVDV